MTDNEYNQLKDAIMRAKWLCSELGAGNSFSSTNYTKWFLQAQRAETILDNLFYDHLERNMDD